VASPSGNIGSGSGLLSRANCRVGVCVPERSLASVWPGFLGAKEPAAVGVNRVAMMKNRRSVGRPEVFRRRRAERTKTGRVVVWVDAGRGMYVCSYVHVPARLPDLEP